MHAVLTIFMIYHIQLNLYFIHKYIYVFNEIIKTNNTVTPTHLISHIVIYKQAKNVSNILNSER